MVIIIIIIFISWIETDIAGIFFVCWALFLIKIREICLTSGVLPVSIFFFSSFFRFVAIIWHSFAFSFFFLLCFLFSNNSVNFFNLNLRLFFKKKAKKQKVKIQEHLNSNKLILLLISKLEIKLKFCLFLFFSSLSFFYIVFLINWIDFN